MLCYYDIEIVFDHENMGKGGLKICREIRNLLT